jgi:hypothetical protein
LNEYTPDWDIIYPISVFLDGYEFPLSPEVEAVAKVFDWPEMGREIISDDVHGGRRIEMTLDFVSMV